MWHHASCSIWFLTPLRRQNILGPARKVAHRLLKHVDQSWVEVASAQGVKAPVLLTGRVRGGLQRRVLTAQLIGAVLSVIMVGALVY